MLVLVVGFIPSTEISSELRGSPLLPLRPIQLWSVQRWRTASETHEKHLSDQAACRKGQMVDGKRKYHSALDESTFVSPPKTRAHG